MAVSKVIAANHKSREAGDGIAGFFRLYERP
jgi:hypothetical protein